MSRRVLGIDPGTRTGWALLDNGARVASGTWDLSVKRNESEGMRFIRLEQQLEQVLAGGVDLVAFEEVKRHLGTIAAHVYGGITAIIKATCDKTTKTRKPVPYQGILVGTVKLRATGKGNAGKPAMVAAAMARFTLGPTEALYPGPTRTFSEDEADALWIALCGTELLGQTQNAPDSAQEGSNFDSKPLAGPEQPKGGQSGNLGHSDTKERKGRKG